MGINPKEEIQQRAVDMYHADWKTSAIAKELGVHAGTVRRWFKKRGIPARKMESMCRKTKKKST